ncbi:MAG: hypothetical protein QOJ89_633 [bacterium]|jgi:hypothetical protein
MADSPHRRARASRPAALAALLAVAVLLGGGTLAVAQNGANRSGPYDPSGVGLPSGNGSENNNGKAPCAGCVGKADAKNPPGQMPNGGDANAGYECDRNQGVGKTNPAHSGCTSGAAPPPPAPPPAVAPPPPPGGPPPPPPRVAPPPSPGGGPPAGGGPPGLTPPLAPIGSGAPTTAGSSTPSRDVAAASDETPGSGDNLPVSRAAKPVRGTAGLTG